MKFLVKAKYKVNFMENSGVLQLEFSDLVGLEAVKVLHAQGISDQLPKPLLNLLLSAGGKTISPVYDVSSEEIVEDKYGFARSFTLNLESDTASNQAYETLQNSPLIKTVEEVSFSQPF